MESVCECGTAETKIKEAKRVYQTKTRACAAQHGAGCVNAITSICTCAGTLHVKLKCIRKERKRIKKDRESIDGKRANIET